MMQVSKQQSLCTHSTRHVQCLCRVLIVSSTVDLVSSSYAIHCWARH